MNHAAITRFATREPICCAVCRRRASWIGYAPQQNGKIIWCCGETKCTRHLKDVYRMSAADFDRFEGIAVNKAGDIAGEYLDSIGKTDLATLDPVQWHVFLTKVVFGFGEAMRQVLDEEIPF